MIHCPQEHQESQCPSVPVTCTECGRKDIPRSQVSYAPRGFVLPGVLFLHTPRNNDSRFKFDLQRTRKRVNGFLTAGS